MIERRACQALIAPIPDQLLSNQPEATLCSLFVRIPGPELAVWILARIRFKIVSDQSHSSYCAAQ
jgi:hypothetical protein